MLLRRLWIQITADRRRLGLFCMLLVLGLLLWARIIVTTDIPPQSYAGDRLDVAPTVAIGAGSAALSDNRPGASARVALDLWWRRDPLAISDAPEHFPKPYTPGALEQDREKSPADAAENMDRTEIRRQRLQELVDRFSLEALMTRGQPIAVINGRLLRVGDRIEAIGSDQVVFELVEVGERSITLECEGHRFPLEMKRTQQR